MNTGEIKLKKATLFFDQEAKDKIMEGVTKMVDMVTMTLGPGGKNIAIEDTTGNPTISKDGVTIAKAIKLPPPYNIGAELIKKASQRVARVVGDGTTTVMVLAKAFIDYAQKEMKEKGKSSKDLFKDLDEDVKVVIDNLNKSSLPITSDLAKKIIHTSTNGDDEITDTIHAAYEMVGDEGLILVGESKSIKTVIEKAKGYKFDAGYFSPQFIKDGVSTKIELENVRFLIHDKKIERLEHIKPLLVECSQNKESLIVIADDIDTQVLAQFIMNTRNNYMDIIFVKSPSYGENRYNLLKDISALTGSTFITQNDGIALWEARVTDLGKAEKVTLTADSIVIEGPQKNEQRLSKRLMSALGLSQNHEISEFERDQAKRRMAQLENKTATILVGGYSEVDVQEKLDRYDDAIKSLQSAIISGVLPGGGWGLWNVINLMKGKNIFKTNTILSVCMAPFEKIMKNADISKEQIKAFDSNFPYYIEKGEIIQPDINYLTGMYPEQHWSFIKCFDPTKVQTESLKTALEVAKTIINTHGIILNEAKYNINQEDEYQF